MNQMFDPSTVILAILAVFIVWKLRSVLGTRTGEERPPFNPFARRDSANPAATQESGRVIPLPGAAPARTPVRDSDSSQWTDMLAPGSADAAAGLSAIAAADPSFSGKGFLEGARAAYELIVAAFAKGDADALKQLLARDVLDGFTAAIAARTASGDTIQHTFVGFDKEQIEDAQMRGRTAQITVRFESQQINAVHKRDGSVETGSDLVGHVVDHWTFARDVDARDPNWRLVATNAD